ncbi:MAG: S53 family peptidase [Ktedonobacteraceae bacterium]
MANTSNTPPQGYERLSGSERQPLPNSRLVGPVDPNESVEVTVYLRTPSTSNLVNTINEQVQQHGRHLSREEYAANHSASPDDIAKVVDFAGKNDLTVVEKDPVGRKVVLAGTAAAMSAAFATELQRYEHPNGTYRGRTGPIHVPSELDQVIVGVFGLDNRPQAQPHLQLLDKMMIANTANAANVSYTPVQVAQLYDFPTGTADNGRGECIALIELGGGYKNKDLHTYFQKLNIPMPKVTSVSVDRGHNHPAGTVDSADGEVDLDIEVAGAIAPGAHIAVYFAPNTDQGFLDAVTNAVHDTTHNPSVISISWGSAEANWTAQAMQAMDAAFQAAAAIGVTVCVAAGDNGSSDGVTDGLAHVDFPASSPYALACGGTRLETANNSAPTETVWNDGTNSATGGGISDVFDLPTWQANAKVPPSVNANHRVGRGLPDVAGNADPQTGYSVYVDGQSAVFGGTSAVAPLWAGLIALINQQRGLSVGYLNPILYQNYAQLVQANALRDVTSGNNGAYSAGPGWDACSGVGSPDGSKLRDALTSAELPGASRAQ